MKPFLLLLSFFSCTKLPLDFLFRIFLILDFSDFSISEFLSFLERSHL